MQLGTDKINSLRLFLHPVQSEGNLSVSARFLVGSRRYEHAQKLPMEGRVANSMGICFVICIISDANLVLTRNSTGAVETAQTAHVEQI